MTAMLAAAILTVSASALLAVALAVAEPDVVRGGMCHIDINSGAKRLAVKAGRSLFATLRSQGLFVPSACGGYGTCGYCKVKVLTGGGPVTPAEPPLVSADEIAAGVRLSCQVKVRGDMAIEVPDHLFRVRRYRGAVEHLRDLTHDIRLVRIRLVEPETIDFVAGQYVQLQTPMYGDLPRPVDRAFSVASPPGDNHHVELIIRRVPGGICTTWVFTLLKEGDEVLLNGPHGEFRLSDSRRPMVWIAGGSGLAPFWGLVRHMKATGLARPCRLFFGALARLDLFLMDELRHLEQELDWFTFIPALSAVDESDAWDGDRGLVTEVLGRRLADGADVEAYLCGSSGMIQAAIKVLEAKGVARDRIFYDKFD